MKVEILNHIIRIDDPTEDLESDLTEKLSYIDKSKQYQIKKMQKNPFSMRSKLYQQLVQQSKGTLLEKVDNTLFVPCGFSNYLIKILSNQAVEINDLRSETGSTISLPWVNKNNIIELRDYQKEAVEKAMCHAKGQLILMFDGSLKAVEDIVVGDRVMGPDSKPRTVLHTTSGFGEMFKITPVKGDPFIVNGNHLLSLRRSYSSLNRKVSKNKYRHKNSQLDDNVINVSVYDYFNQTKSFKHKYKLYRSDLIEFNTEEQDLPIDPYILGLWLGDGISADSAIVNVDNEIIDSIYQFAKTNNLNVIKYKDNITYRLSGDGSLGSNMFLTNLKELNLLKNKHIPHVYKTASINQRLQLLAGLLDTDGHYSEGLFDISQKNKKLAEDIVYVARSLGLAAYVKERFKVATNSKEKIKRSYYNITISGHINKIPTKVIRKQALNRKQIKNVLNVGFKIEKVQDSDFYGFTVDHDHLYLLNDFTVIHNCNYRGIINLATGLGKTKSAIVLIRQIKKKTLIICPSNSVANQFKDELTASFGPGRVGFIGDGKYRPADITVCIAASAFNSIEKIKKMDLGLIIFDEVHHIAANTFFSISQNLSSVGRVYGLTATSFRSDGKDVMITAGCGDVLVKRDAAWGVANKWLADPYFIVRKIKTTGIDFKDDKLKSYKTHVLNCKEMTSRIESDARKFMDAKKSVLILVDEVEHGEMLSKALSIPFAQGEDKQSNTYVDQLNKGLIPGLVGTDGKISEGTDTRNVDVLILANFSASKGAVLQAVGRGLRKTDTKNSVIILDYMPTGSSMLTRHANQRISYYKEITSNIKLVE